MAYNDKYRLSSHAVIINEENEVLLLKATYGTKGWGLPGGALEPGETIHDALFRECFEELGVKAEVKYLSGVYYHSVYESQAFIFRAELKSSNIVLSEEHSEYKYTKITELSDIQKQRVNECINFNGVVQSDKF